MKPKSDRGLLLGAAFLMATSAIGPGFLTQTCLFTGRFGASFGFVILASIVLDIGAQLNIWRIIAVCERRAQDILNAVLPGLGYLLAAMVVLGGLAFNIGNVAGAGLGLNVLCGLTVESGAMLSATAAIGLFLAPQAGRAMDRSASLLGFVMIGLTMYVAYTARPPVAEAVVRTVVPEVADIDRPAFLMAIVTLVGGTVGGYITFAGGHRLFDAGVKGVEALPEVTRSSLTGILVTACMRGVLFLAALGIVSQGLMLDVNNPAASVFQLAAGDVGYRMFGVVMWAAAITSVVGSAYTSVSFIRSFHPAIERLHRYVIVGFIVISTAIFLSVGKPVPLLILAGAVNGVILPIALALMLAAVYRTSLVGSYRHPVWLTLTGAAVVAIMSYLGAVTLFTELPKLFAAR